MSTAVDARGAAWARLQEARRVRDECKLEASAWAMVIADHACDGKLPPEETVAEYRAAVRSLESAQAVVQAARDLWRAAQ